MRQLLVMPRKHLTSQHSLSAKYRLHDQVPAVAKHPCSTAATAPVGNRHNDTIKLSMVRPVLCHEPDTTLRRIGILGPHQVGRCMHEIYQPTPRPNPFSPRENVVFLPVSDSRHVAALLRTHAFLDVAKKKSLLMLRPLLAQMFVLFPLFFSLDT